MSTGKIQIETKETCMMHATIISYVPIKPVYSSRENRGRGSKQQDEIQDDSKFLMFTWQ
jgi:hypothetical protein